MPFGGFSDFEDCVRAMGQRESVDDPEAVCGKLKAEQEKRAMLTRDEVAKLCPLCAEKMRALQLTAIRSDLIAKVLASKMSDEDMHAACAKEDDPDACLERMKREMGSKDEKDYDKGFRIAKTDDDRRLVFGWANVAMAKDGKIVLDRQGDLIAPETLEEAAYKYVLLHGDANEMHTEPSVGHMVESFVATPEKLEKMGLAKDALPRGWWIGFYVEDEAVYAKVKSGEYKAFSIEGSGVREEAFA